MAVFHSRCGFMHSLLSCSLKKTRFVASMELQQLQQASRFCTENGLHGDDDKRNLAGQMEEAIAGLKTRHISIGRGISESERASEEANRNGPDRTDRHETDARLLAIVRLQKARARVMEESTTSFEQVTAVLIAFDELCCLCEELLRSPPRFKRLSGSCCRNEHSGKMDTRGTFNLKKCKRKQRAAYRRRDTHQHNFWQPLQSTPVPVVLPICTVLQPQPNIV